MSTSSTSSATNKKLKLEVILIIILAVILIGFLIFGNGFSLSNLFNNSTITNSNYQQNLEAQLESLISNLDGAGKVKVMVTLSGSESEVLAKNTESIEENGVIKTIETIITVSGKPYVTKTENPDINGVIIICEGGDDLTVKMNITEIITTALNVSADKIRILKMK